nr:hemoblobin-interacting domain-containing protein [uncultured Agathobaculum sp.]
MVDLGWSQYVAVRFTDGNSLADCTLTVDGTDVTSTFTPVTDDGSIVKWEVSSLNPAELTVTKAGQSQTVTLSGNSAPAEPVVVEDTAPAYMIAHGPLAYWDYYLTNYDDDGNLRVEPAKTTFSLSDDVVSDVPAFYSPDAELREGDSFGEVVGKAVIMFNYNTDAEKAWFDAIPDNRAQTVQLVSYDGNKTTLNDSLTYEKAAGISHGGGSVGQITVALGQENFRTNGRYYIRIRSAGHDTALVPIHVVNEQAPTLKLSGPGTVQSGQNVSFEIENMTYGITDPTYAAELKRPDGETVALEVITDWYQFGNRLTLYNDGSAENGRNNIPYNGSYTLTVHSNGFKDMSITFNVTGGENAPQKNVLTTVDAISRATGGGTSGGESGSGGGSISANLKFDADLLINAKVLNELGIENEAAQGINDRWKDDMAGWDSVWTEDGRPYDWNDYITAVNNARNEGKYLTFAEYTETADQDQSGTPYAIKAVLEDNMLGDIQYNGEWVGQAAPALTLVNPNGSAADAVTEGNDVVLTADDGAYFSALERINVNGNSMDLSDELYRVEENKLTIDSNALTLGERNTVTLYAKGYRANRLSILYQKTLEQNLSLSTDKTNYNRSENIVITVNNSEGDFLEHLTNVTLHKPGSNTATVSAQGVQSDTEYYTVSGNRLTIVDTRGTLLKENGEYYVALEAEYYNRLTTPAFTVQGDLKAAPQPETGNKDSDGNYTLTFASVPYDWKDSLSVTVNGRTYTENTDRLSNVSADEFEWSAGTYGGYVLTMHPSVFARGENTITLSAAGYEPLTVKVSGETGEIMTDSGGTEEPEPEPGEGQMPPAVAEVNKVTGYEPYFRVSFKDDAAAYLSALRAGEATVTVNDETCGYAITFLGGKQYKISDDLYGEPAYLDFSKDCFSTDGDTVVKISVEGYTDLTFTVDENGQLVAGDTPEDAAEVPAYGWEYSSFPMFGGHKLYFDRTGNAEESATAYLSAVTNVQVGETVYTAYTGSFLGNGQYKIVKDRTEKYIELSDSAFSETGNTEIHIKATGYKDLNLTVTAGGKLVTE